MTATLRHSPCGRLVPIENGGMAFVPDPLPRSLNLSPSLINLLDQASRAVATLSGVGETVPNPNLLIQPFMRREAVLSSRIEGTQASLSDLFRFEASDHHRHPEDVREVSNYVRALQEGLRLLEDLPISGRLANQLHSILMHGVRGGEKRPGQIRTRQVWIGAPGTPVAEARFVPPLAQLVPDALADLERFANEEMHLPPLAQCALLHYQFEAIHPYLDGNGRVGRLLIVLFLCAKQVLPTPLLYLSAYFEADRQEYYDQLSHVSATGDWEEWLNYFLKGVFQQARDALLRIRQLRALHENYRGKLQANRESVNALRLADELFIMPYTTTPRSARMLGLSAAGARRILERLVAQGILAPVEGSWPRLYFAEELLDIIEAESAGEPKTSP